MNYNLGQNGLIKSPKPYSFSLSGNSTFYVEQLRRAKYFKLVPSNRHCSGGLPSLQVSSYKSSRSPASTVHKKTSSLGFPGNFTNPIPLSKTPSPVIRRIIPLERYRARKRKLPFEIKVQIRRKQMKEASCLRCQSMQDAVPLSAEQSLHLRETHSLMLELASSMNPITNLPTSISSQELALDVLALLEGEGSMSSQETEHFRVMLLGLNEKLKTLALSQKKNVEYREQLLISIRAQEQTHQSVQETLNEVQRQKNAQDLVNARLTEDRNSFKAQLDTLKLQHREKNNQFDLLLSQHKLLQSEHEKLKAEERNFESMSVLIAHLQETVASMEQARSALRTQYQHSLDEFHLVKEQMNDEMLKLTQENKDLGRKLEDTAAVVRDLENNRNDLNEKLTASHSLISTLKADLYAVQDQASKAKTMEELARTHHESIKKLNKQIQDSDKAFLKEIEKMNSEKENMQDSLRKEKEKYLQLTEKSNLQDQENYKLKENKRELEEYLAKVEEALCLQEDNMNIIDVMQDFKNTKDEMMDAFYNELDHMADKVLTSSEHNLSHQRVSAKLTQAMADKNSEIDLLRDMIVQLQQMRTYCPVKDDPIDMALAEYLNSRAEHLEIPFVREDQGIYLFGSKRVFMKMEQGKIILRIGGGFMHIDQFIEIYTPLEIEKFEKRESQATKANASINQHLKDRPGISPMKAARLIKKAISGSSSSFAPLTAVPRRSSKSPLKHKKSTSLIN